MPYIPGEILSEQLTYLRNSVSDLQDHIQEIEQEIALLKAPVEDINDAIQELAKLEE